MSISVIKKRDGRIVPFDVQKITNAIEKSLIATEAGKNWEPLATDLALKVFTLLDLEGNPAPTVEHVQDIVEQVLMREGQTQTAKNYILYRQERSRIRQQSDEAAARFGGAPLTLTDTLSDCESIEDAVFAAYGLLHERREQTVPDFPQAMAPAVAASFAAAYRQAQRIALELLAGIRVNEATQQAWSAGLAQKGLFVTLSADQAALSREADLICGTLGCDRDTVTKAQAGALRFAEETVTAALRDGITRLCAAAEMKKAALCGSADTPEAQLVLTALQDG